MPNSNTDHKDATSYSKSLDEIPSSTASNETVKTLEEHGFTVLVTDSASETFESIRSRIIANASALTSNSNTLKEIGF